MSVEGFLLRKKKYKTRHNMYQLVCTDPEKYDLDIITTWITKVGDVAENNQEIWTTVPLGYRWELVR